MKRLLITGGCGFIGANFIRYLLDETDFSGLVINVDALTYAANPANLTGIARDRPNRYVFEHADIRERERMLALFERYDVDSVCHFAAESHVDRSIASPGDFVTTNIVGTYNLLEAARARGSNFIRFHHVSTDEVFGSLGATGYFSEETPYRPNSPYSASKASSDHLVRAYRETYRLPVTISNCSNNYGPYQFPEKLIPLMILNARDGVTLPVYGDGMNVRDWLYVRDHAAAVWRVLKHGRDGETYTVGGRCEMPNIDVVKTICDLVDEYAPALPGRRSRRELITFVKDRPGHDRRYAIDCSRIERELGWRPEETFDSGLRRTVRWYLEETDWVAAVRSGAYRDWIELNYGERR